jgi:SGNH domain (fused to AT3 domains)
MASYGGCIPALNIERADLGVCDAVNQAVLRHVLASPALKTVILAGRWALWTEGTRYKMEDRLPKEIVITSPGARETKGNRTAVEQGLAALVEKLKAAGKDVWLVGPVPEIGYPVPRAMYLARLGSFLAKDIRPRPYEFDERQQFVLGMLERLTTRYGAHLILPHRELCGAEHCNIEARGSPLYADDDHLTVLGAQSVGARFEPIFAR